MAGRATLVAAAVAAFGILCLCAPQSASAQGARHHHQKQAQGQTERGDSNSPAPYYNRTTRPGFTWLGKFITPTEIAWPSLVVEQNNRLPHLNYSRNRPVMNNWEDMNWTPNNDFNGRWPREAYWH